MIKFGIRQSFDKIEQVKDRYANLSVPIEVALPYYWDIYEPIEFHEQMLKDLELLRLIRILWKKYYHILRQEVCSQLDEWIFEYLVDQNEYAAYLERYRPAKARGEIGDIDEHIMDMHYRPQAIKILRRKKSFDLACWIKKRVCLEYHRR